MIVHRVDLKRHFSDQIPKRGHLTHSFDRYPAKMIPAMAKFLIEIVSKPGQTVLDPFCGSGAVLVEALSTCRNTIGVDINPIAIILANAKTTKYDCYLLEKQLKYLIRSFRRNDHGDQYDFINVDYWFTPGTIRKLGVIKHVLDQFLPAIESEYSSFWQGVFAMIVRDCSRADTRGPKPFISKTARKTRFGKHFNPFKYFESTARFWILLTNRFAERLKKEDIQNHVRVIEGDTRGLSRLINNYNVDAIVTSPPYLNAQDYYRSCKLEVFVLGLLTPEELRKWSRHLIGNDRIIFNETILLEPLRYNLADELKHKILMFSRKNAFVFTKYVLDMSLVFNEFNKILKDGNYCALVSGHNQISGIMIPTYDVIIEIATNHGFMLTDHYVDKIRDRWVPTIRNGHNGVIKDEHLLIFQKLGHAENS